MKRHSLTLFLISLGLCTFGFATPLHAQLSTSLTASVSVNIVPENPKPNEVVSVSLESYTTDLNAATITWKINGKTEKTGKGLKTFTFEAGGMNVNTKLDIVILTAEGETIDNTYNIKPTSVDLIWQSYGFVPPFYKGKSLFSYQNKIQFIALPHITNSSGQEISAKNLIYKWTVNSTVMSDFSGYGMNTYTTIGSIISRPLNIEVDVSSPDTGGTGYAKTTVSPVRPTVLMYEKSPLYGIQFQKTLTGTIGMDSSKEVAVIGVPMFFGVTDAGSYDLKYKWSINGASVSENTDQTMQVFRQKEGTTGTSYISLSIENLNKVLQSASNGFNLKFGE